MQDITAVYLASGQSFTVKKGSVKPADSPLGTKDGTAWLEFEADDRPGTVLVPSTAVSALVMQK